MRWFLAGSIGLDTVVRRQNLGDTINDLSILSDFGAFSRDTACDFIQELARARHLLVPTDVQEHLLFRIGWPIPFHIQLFVSELEAGTSASKRTVATEDVELPANGC